MDKWLDLVREAASKVGVEAARLWPQVVGITFVENLIKTVATLVLTGLALVVAEKTRRGTMAARAAVRPGSEEEVLLYGLACGCVVGMFLVITLSFASLSDSVPGVFYPEAKTVLNLIKQTVK